MEFVIDGFQRLAQPSRRRAHVLGRDGGAAFYHVERPPVTTRANEALEVRGVG